MADKIIKEVKATGCSYGPGTSTARKLATTNAQHNATKEVCGDNYEATIYDFTPIKYYQPKGPGINYWCVDIKAKVMCKQQGTKASEKDEPKGTSEKPSAKELTKKVMEEVAFEMEKLDKKGQDEVIKVIIENVKAGKTYEETLSAARKKIKELFIKWRMKEKRAST